MVDINSVTLSGRIYSEFKHIPSDSGKVEITFQLACEGWEGARKTGVSIFHVKAKGSQAKYLLDYAAKDDVLFVQGRLKNCEKVGKQSGKTLVIVYVAMDKCRLVSKGGQ